MLAGIGAALIGPLQDDELALVIRKLLHFAVAVGGGEIGGRLSNLGGECGKRKKCQQTQDQNSEIAFHGGSPPCIPKMLPKSEGVVGGAQVVWGQG